MNIYQKFFVMGLALLMTEPLLNAAEIKGISSFSCCNGCTVGSSSQNGNSGVGGSCSCSTACGAIRAGALCFQLTSQLRVFFQSLQDQPLSVPYRANIYVATPDGCTLVGTVLQDTATVTFDAVGEGSFALEFDRAFCFSDALCGPYQPFMTLDFTFDTNIASLQSVAYFDSESFYTVTSAALQPAPIILPIRDFTVNSFPPGTNTSGAYSGRVNFPSFSFNPGVCSTQTTTGENCDSCNA